MTDRNHLRRVAEAATLGPWTATAWNGTEEGGWAAIGPHHLGEIDEDDGPGSPSFDKAMADAAFIAAANPAAVLELLDRIAALEALLREALPYVRYYRDKGACAGREESELVKHINAALSIPEVSKWVTTRARG